MNNNLSTKYKIVKSDITKISGAIGLTILFNLKMNKKIYLFFDDHSNKTYCSGNINFLDEIYHKLENKYSNMMFLLEEPLISSETKILSLWDDSTHIIKFRKHYAESKKKCFYTKICKTFPIDIRLCLFDVSIDEMIINYNNDSYFESINYLTPNYFRNILFIFDLISLEDFYELSLLNKLDKSNESVKLNSTIDYSNLSESDTNIIWIKKVFNVFKNSDYYIKLKSAVELLLIKYILPNKKVLIKDFITTLKKLEYSVDVGFPFVISIFEYNVLDLFDHIINSIMEFYTIILTNYLESDVILINSGFFHGMNIKYILTKYYDYKIIYDVGVTTIDKIKLNIKYSNCIEVDNKYL